MFNIKWDPEVNGVLLTTEEGDVNLPVRPVFYEELDLIGFPELGFNYPKSVEPILWAAGRNYYYKGEKIATSKGGGYYENIKLEILTKNRKLEKMDINLIIDRNRDKIIFYTHDSIDFIRSTVEKYRDVIDSVTVSYSGGKDSIVVIDLVNRALDNNTFVVIFADTKMESPDTYNTINQFIHENPSIKFLKAEYDLDPLYYWSQFGPPSRTLRWCHTVFKTTPYIKTIRKYLKNNSPKVLTFEGSRAEESPKRSTYQPIHEGPKDICQINARPVLYWSSLEIFLYIFSQNLPLNNSYRKGYTRVGCVICPYTSSWGDYIASSKIDEYISPFIALLRKVASQNGVQDVEKFINDGEWKKRSGGKYLNLESNKVTVTSNKDEILIKLSNPSSNFIHWLKAFRPVVYSDHHGNFEFKNKIYSITQSKQKNHETFKIHGEITNEVLFPIMRVANKAGYCIKCGACEAVCSFDALKIESKSIINEKNCIHCLNCLNFVEKGCWVALSLRDSSGVNNMKETGSMDRYSTFGLRKEWLIQYLQKGDEWDWGGLGNKQVESMKRWLLDSEFREKSSKSSSELGKLFIEYNKPSDLFMWSVIWYNLGCEGNSPLIRWYQLEVEKGEYKKDDLINCLAGFRGVNEPNRTDANAIGALCNLLDQSPIGSEMGMGRQESIDAKKHYKKGQIVNIPDLAILYSIFRYAEKQKRKQLVASELITTKDSTPYWVYGLEYNAIKAILIRLASQYPDLFYAEFSGNLDNIILSNDKNSLDVVKAYIKSNS
jgi:phosphoadenosine phosphosulfate reductase